MYMGYGDTKARYRELTSTGWFRELLEDGEIDLLPGREKRLYITTKGKHKLEELSMILFEKVL